MKEIYKLADEQSGRTAAWQALLRQEIIIQDMRTKINELVDAVNKFKRPDDVSGLVRSVPHA